MRYEEYILKDDATLATALELLENNEYKALIIESEGSLTGVLTDGDIRRFLLKGGNLLQQAGTIATKNPISVSGYHEQAARDLLEKYDCTVVPMLNREGIIHALVFKDNTLHRKQDYIDNHVIIMAGGLGTRLYPYTEILPKPLIPVGQSTITELIAERFKKFGCRNITLVVNHKKNLIKSYFSEVDTDCDLSFVDEDIPLGTGGGLAFFKGRFSQPVFVTYCDNVIEADYCDILNYHKNSGNDITMVVSEKTVGIPYGVIDINNVGEVTAIREKPVESYLINTGFYVVSPSFIETVKDNCFQHMTDLITAARLHGLKTGGYRIEENCFIDIGKLEDIKSLGNKLR